MSASELVIYKSMSRINQITYLTNAKQAVDMTATNFPNIIPHNNKADAFRHAFFSVMNTFLLGKDPAKNLGDAHEEKLGNDILEKQMDLFNNNVGRELFGGPYYSAAAFSQKVMSALQAGQLVYINGTSLTPTNR